MTRLSELGESHVLERILSHIRGGSQVIIGPGDDAAVTAVEGNLVSTADMLVENEDFTRTWLDWSRLGVKAAAQNLSDVCVMGAVPHGLLVSLAVPNSTDIEDLEALFAGIVAEAARAGEELDCDIPIIGGDLSSSGLIVVAITALGTVGGPEATAAGSGAAITRAGAKPGDSIYLAGTIGRAAAGLDLLFAGLGDRTGNTGDRAGNAGDRSGNTGEQPELDASLKELISTQLAPQPDYAAVLSMGAASAMIDVSDGLSTDLGRVAAASGVHADIDRAALQELIDPLLPAARYLLASAKSTDEVEAPEEGAEAPAPVAEARSAEELALSWVLNGGEDHGFVASSMQFDTPPVGWRRIGEMTVGSGVSLDGAPVPTSGFSHFGK
ncbi:thiamine-monophosphate kinase [Brevibacterium sp. 239c]|uniref:thiamine-phosphate kinase n=1 Tax=Brevibacterium sp. 239c TaxID=1965356 RepID=UPI000C3D8ED9|nr:thiamine-phosphate kinase [Brevibacterium sp. 239c]SMX81089.1 thiamine-monophosphate kinase [Brevibacterium sp. 239c]